MRLRILLSMLCALWLLPATGALAQTPLPAAPGAERPRVALVLSGGGARGFAHVGVLKALEAARVPVDMVVGTSMGAIVGGLYASGMDATVVEQEVQRLDWDNVFASRVDRRELSQRRKEHDFEVSPLLEVGIGSDGLKAPLGSLSSRVLEAHLRRLTLSASHIRHFDQLPTPFRAVATDMESGQPVVLGRGDLAAAMRASMSVPGVFAPLELDGRILGDGGLVNNLPVDVARQLGADVVIDAAGFGVEGRGRGPGLGRHLAVSCLRVPCPDCDRAVISERMPALWPVRQAITALPATSVDISLPWVRSRTGNSPAPGCGGNSPGDSPRPARRSRRQRFR